MRASKASSFSPTNLTNLAALGRLRRKKRLTSGGWPPLPFSFFPRQPARVVLPVDSFSSCLHQDFLCGTP
jgi:hypothetical protein